MTKPRGRANPEAIETLKEIDWLEEDIAVRNRIIEQLEASGRKTQAFIKWQLRGMALSMERIAELKNGQEATKHAE